MRKSSYFEDGDIIELETHLRDQIEALTGSGMEEEAAFNKAVADLGTPGMIGEELHRNRSRSSGLLKALSFNIPLVENQLRVAFRKLKKNRGFALINLAGLSAGLCVCFLIFLYIQDELSYDKFHERAERIYRIENEWRESETGNLRRDARVPITWAEALVQSAVNS